jgi:hypothetical protein
LIPRPLQAARTNSAEGGLKRNRRVALRYGFPIWTQRCPNNVQRDSLRSVAKEVSELLKSHAFLVEMEPSARGAFGDLGLEESAERAHAARVILADNFEAQLCEDLALLVELVVGHETTFRSKRKSGGLEINISRPTHSSESQLTPSAAVQSGDREQSDDFVARAFLRDLWAPEPHPYEIAPRPDLLNVRRECGIPNSSRERHCIWPA